MIAQDQLIGARFEKCVVERLIGRGGYGLTFLAFDEELQEHRVIKISQDAGLDEASRRRHLKTFLEEGLILSRLKHPQIVTLRGQGDKHGHRYMILDYIQGFSLRAALDVIGQRQSDLGCAWPDLLDPVSATALILSALYPLEYAHRANVHLPDREIFGVAHRDISPGNLILGVKGNEKGKLVLIDFGTAKTALTENVTVDQNLVGTLPYMGKARLQKANTPEQRAEYHDFWKDFRETQHDIHAIGVLYYQLLTGRLPFYGETSPQVIVKILDPEVYSQCHLEIASAHGFASGVLRKCLVYHDFSQPLSEQPYQYPDAASMRPDLEEVFHSLAGGRTVHEILIALGKKLAHPELLIPVDDRQTTDQATSGVMPTLPQPVDFASGLPFPPKRRSPAVYAAFLACGLALTLATAWWLGPRQSHLAVAQSRSIGPEAEPHAEGHLTDEAARSSNGPAAASKSKAAPKRPRGLETLEKWDVPPRSRAKGMAAPRLDGTTGPTAGSGLRPEGESVASNGKASVAEGEAAAGEVPGLVREDWGKEGFIRVQTLVREEDPAAFEKITALLAIRPDSPDLRLLKAQVELQRDPSAQETRRELASLPSTRPEYMHPAIFHEQVLYLLWETDAAIFAARNSPVNRVNLLKSANAYLSEFGANPAYRQKVQGIKDRLPR